MGQIVLFASLMLWGTILMFSRVGFVLHGDFSHRLEYGLRGNVRPPFGLWALAVLAFLDTAALLYAAVPGGGLMAVAAVTLVGFICLILLWIGLDWKGWRQGWLEAMIERPHEFWPRLDRFLWLSLTAGALILGWAIYVLRDFLMHSRAI